ncbi:MAG TPA: lipocalin-like domain-containing protein [Bryobacteraceae bacterium]|nr:lipocalin-like domain-containing protein [Bryobacteraceae bacterium]
MARTLAGGWQLVSRAVTSENGAPVVDRSLGATPTGYLTYDPGGRMAVQIMRNDRSAAIDCGVSDSTVVANNTQSISGYDAYFGTYTVDESKRTVTHHAEGALVASDVGKNLVRTFELSGDRLRILVDNQSLRGRLTIALTWKRVH